MIAKLNDCPACQKPVSAAALKCPSCGHPLRSVGWRGFKYLVALAAAVVAIWFLWSAYSASQAEINGPLHIETIPPSAK